MPIIRPETKYIRAMRVFNSWRLAVGGHGQVELSHIPIPERLTARIGPVSVMTTLPTKALCKTDCVGSREAMTMLCSARIVDIYPKKIVRAQRSFLTKCRMSQR